jgi:hypothetical protein
MGYGCGWSMPDRCDLSGQTPVQPMTAPARAPVYACSQLAQRRSRAVCSAAFESGARKVARRIVLTSSSVNSLDLLWTGLLRVASRTPSSGLASALPASTAHAQMV